MNAATLLGACGFSVIDVGAGTRRFTSWGSIAQQYPWLLTGAVYDQSELCHFNFKSSILIFLGWVLYIALCWRSCTHEIVFVISTAHARCGRDVNNDASCTPAAAAASSPIHTLALSPSLTPSLFLSLPLSLSLSVLFVCLFACACVSLWVFLHLCARVCV